MKSAGGDPKAVGGNFSSRDGRCVAPPVTGPLGRGSVEGKCALQRNAKSSIRRAIAPEQDDGGALLCDGPRGAAGPDSDAGPAGVAPDDRVLAAAGEDVEPEVAEDEDPVLADVDEVLQEHEIGDGSRPDEAPRPGRLVLGAAWSLPAILAAAYTPDGPDLDMDFDPDTGEMLPRRGQDRYTGSSEGNQGDTL
ncbi:hypothetical protein [Microbacterium sp. 22242]|uniref:hypothetical protein n=1 Tax=Microbacterium sp. 22242 TaxID=3453896 RepID=UPI003F871034